MPKPLINRRKLSFKIGQCPLPALFSSVRAKYRNTPCLCSKLLLFSRKLKYMETHISVISINYNNPSDTFRFLRSVYKLNPAHLEVIIVDNGSTEDISPVLKTYFPKVVTVRSEKNLGFAGGNNLGVAAASGEYIYFVNNDALFLEDHFEALAKRLAENPKIGAISPQLIFPDGRIQFQGKSEMNLITGRSNNLSSDEKGLLPTAFIHGGAVMLSKKVLQKAGLMPENYFLYYEELSWSEQLKAAGYELYMDLSHEIVHDESGTTSKISDLKTYFMTRNRLLFMRNHAGKYFGLFLVYFTLIALPKCIWTYCRSKEFNHIKATIAGVLWHIFHTKDSHQLGYKFNHLSATLPCS